MVVGGGKGLAVWNSCRSATAGLLVPVLLAGIQPPDRRRPDTSQRPQAPPSRPQQDPYGQPAVYYDPQTAASSAATHNRFAAVSTPPAAGSARPAPGGGTPAAGVPPAANPVQQRPAGGPAPSVDALLSETRKDGGGAPKRGMRKGRKKGKELPLLELQNKVIRLSFIIVLVIAITGYVGRYLTRHIASELWNNGIIDFAGVFALGASIFLLMRATSVGGRMRERLSPAEQSRLTYIRMGGGLLWLVPIIGSFGYYVGIVFQASDMNVIFYILLGGGGLAILYGLSGSKERGSFYKIFMFGVVGIVIGTIPMALSALGDVLASSFWWSASFVMISIGFILMAIMVRQMRADQYEQLDKVLSRADKAFTERRFDEAQRHYSEAITLTHTLYADVVFAGRNPRERGGSTIPQEYFRPWVGKAKCLALTGKLRKALAIYDLMLEVDPDNAAVWFDRGRILVAEKRYAEAYISFDRAVKLDPNLEVAKEKRSDVLDVIRKMSL